VDADERKAHVTQTLSALHPDTYLPKRENHFRLTLQITRT
jgi:hypothetical protein